MIYTSTLNIAIAGAFLLGSKIAHASLATIPVRQSQAQVCIEPGSEVTATVEDLKAFAEERGNGVNSPPLIPNCFDLDLGPEAQCLQCQNAATVAYATAVLECSTASFGCGPVEPLCLAGCLAAASFTLYAADQACYCLHADCSDTTVRGSIEQPSLPENVGGGLFNVPGGIVPGVSQTIVSNGQPSECSQVSDQ